MLRIMDVDRAIDSIRLLSLKYRVLNSTSSWLDSFSTGGGVSIIMENIENRLERFPLEELDAAGTYHLLLCIKHIIKTKGLQFIFGTHGLIEAIVSCLHFEYDMLVMEVLEILTVSLHYSNHDEASFHILQGFKYLSKERNEKPMEIFVKALKDPTNIVDIRIQSAIMGFLNAMIVNAVGKASF